MQTIPRKTALITGASRGLGLELARALSRKGWHLIFDARNKAALEAVKSELFEQTRITAISGDVSDENHRQDLAVAAAAHGGLDAVINNAGVLGPSPQPALVHYPLTELESVFRINALAPLALIQRLYPHLKPDARIINVSSDAGVEAYEGWGGYGASKAALEQISAVLAVENPSLRIYWVDPGDMRTQMHQDAFPGEDISDRPLPEASVPGMLRLLEDTFPSGRYVAKELSAAEEVVI